MPTRRTLIVTAAFLCGGCALPIAAGVGAAGAASQVPSWITAAQNAINGVKTLTEAEQLACNVQTAANAAGDKTLAYYAGFGCVW